MKNRFQWQLPVPTVRAWKLPRNVNKAFFTALPFIGHSSKLGIFKNGVLEKKKFQFNNFGNYHQSLHALGLLNLSMVHISWQYFFLPRILPFGNGEDCDGVECDGVEILAFIFEYLYQSAYLGRVNYDGMDIWMDDTWIPKKWFNWRPKTKRPTGRPWKRWIKGVREAVNTRGKDWKQEEREQTFLDRDAWRAFWTDRS